MELGTLRKYALEMIIAIWLTLVAVQYIGSYFFRELELDFAYMYIAMLVLVALTIGWRIYKRLSS